MKQHWKQILSFILAIIITLTPLSSLNQVYATDGDNGSGPGGGKSSSGWTGGWTSNDHVGYRFYVIDTFNNCQRASDVYDFYFSEPLNVVKSKHFTNTRFEDLSTDTSQYHEDNISVLANARDSKTGQLAYNADKIINIRPIALVGGSWVTGGSDFQNWFINKAGKGAGHVGIDTTVNPGQGGQSNKGGTGNEEKDPENPAKGIIEEINNIGPNSISDIKQIAQIKMNEEEFREFLSAESIDQEAYVRALGGAEKERMKQYYLDKLWDCAKEGRLNYSRAREKVALEICDKGNAQSKYLYCKVMVEILNATDTSEVRQKYNFLADPESFGRNIEFSIFNNIPLDGETLYPADVILSQKRTDLGMYVYGFDNILATDSRYKDTSRYADNVVSALMYQVDGKYRYALIVEPLIWIYPYYSNGKTQHETSKAYGTYYNLIQYHIQKGYTHGGAHYGLLHTYGKNSMLVARDYDSDKEKIEFNGACLKASRSDMEGTLSFSKIYELIHDYNYGLGCHVYMAGDFIPTDSSTHTWDKTKTTPDKAPAPPTTPDSTNVGNIVKIVKDYFIDDNGTLTSEGVYTREQNPHTIQIEDEQLTYGDYKVVDWLTSSTENNNIPSDGTPSKWESLTNNRANEVQSGTNAETVSLSETEKIL